MQELYSQRIKRIMSNININEIYNINEMSKILEISRQAILKRIKKDQLPASKMNGKWFVSGKDVLVTFFSDYRDKL